MQIDLRDKKIIVTGASSGIGYALAESLIKAGAEVAIHYNHGEKGARNLLKEGNNSKIFQADLSQEVEVLRLFEEVVNQMALNKEVNIESRYASLRKRKVEGDWRFVVMEKFLSNNNDLSSRNKIIMSLYFILKKFSLSIFIVKKGLTLFLSVIILLSKIGIIIYFIIN